RRECRWATDGILITMAAILDCGQSCFVITTTLIRVIDPLGVHDGSMWCSVSFVVGRSIGLSCLALVALLSLVRYLVIVCGHNSHPKRWTCSAIFSCVFISAVLYYRSTLFELYVYPSKLYCSPIKFNNDFSTAIIGYLILPMSFIPLFTIPYCYARVSFYYYRLVNKLCSEEPSRTRAYRKIAVIIMMVVSYWLVIFPEYILFFSFILFDLHPTPLLDGIVCCLSNCVSLVNALFPLICHYEIRKEARMLFAN
ncbi:hypothetical protein L0F63_006411, partial [Massospora cicadina]